MLVAAAASSSAKSLRDRYYDRWASMRLPIPRNHLAVPMRPDVFSVNTQAVVADLIEEAVQCLPDDLCIFISQFLDFPIVYHDNKIDTGDCFRFWIKYKDRLPGFDGQLMRAFEAIWRSLYDIWVCSECIVTILPRANHSVEVLFATPASFEHPCDEKGVIVPRSLPVPASAVAESTAAIFAGTAAAFQLEVLSVSISTLTKERYREAFVFECGGHGYHYFQSRFMYPTSDEDGPVYSWYGVVPSAEYEVKKLVGLDSYWTDRKDAGCQLQAGCRCPQCRKDVVHVRCGQICAYKHNLCQCDCSSCTQARHAYCTERKTDYCYCNRIGQGNFIAEDAHMENPPSDEDDEHANFDAD